jgi:hypothetical protein
MLTKPRFTMLFVSQIVIKNNSLNSTPFPTTETFLILLGRTRTLLMSWKICQ